MARLNAAVRRQANQTLQRVARAASSSGRPLVGRDSSRHPVANGGINPALRGERPGYLLRRGPSRSLGSRPRHGRGSAVRDGSGSAPARALVRTRGRGQGTRAWGLSADWLVSWGSWAAFVICGKHSSTREAGSRSREWGLRSRGGDFQIVNRSREVVRRGCDFTKPLCEVVKGAN